MSSSTLFLKNADSRLLATGYETSPIDGTIRQIVNYPYNRAHTPSSDLHSNVVDMARWAIANLNRGELDGHRILKTSTYDLMWKPYDKAEDMTKDGKTSVGISWFLKEIEGEKAVWHNGGDDGFLARLVLFPDRKIAVFYMTNCDWLDRDAVDRVVLPVALGLH